MKHLGVLIVATALAAAIASAQAPQQAPPQAPQYKAMQRSGHPLEELITPGADTLIVEKDQFPPMISEPLPGNGELEWLTQLAPAVLVIKVENVQSKLTPARDWIESQVHATIEQILKYNPSVVLGHSVRFSQDGGELVIRGTKVTAVLDYADGFAPKARYLVFAEPTDGDDTLSVQPLVSYLIDGTDHLVPLAHEGKPATERGVPLSTAITRIKAALNKRP